MTPYQRRKLDQLEDELGLTRGTLPIRGESERYVFTEVDGVTVIIARKSTNPRGGFIVPSLHTYPEIIKPTNIDAAICARELFDEQSPVPHGTGHLGPIVRSITWQCGNPNCRCSTEPYEDRVKRSLGYRVGLSKS